MTVGAPQSSHAEAQHWVDQLEHRWSRFLPDSDITRLNLAGGQPCTVDPATVNLIETMISAWHETEHDFDPTLLPDLVRLGYAVSWKHPDRVTTLDSMARPRGRMDQIEIQDNVVTLPRGLTLDPGGIGKGLAADLVAQHLLQLGALGALVDLGGDVRVAGRAPDGVAWTIAVEDPFESDAFRDTVRMREGGIATSSQRKRRWSGEGASPAHHLVDPRTHASADTSVQTVTVLATTAGRAESLTKPGFLRPPRDYLAWLPTRGAAGLLIDAEGREFATDNWGDYT
jgi:thiamine biosynthesis lipoprotein